MEFFLLALTLALGLALILVTRWFKRELDKRDTSSKLAQREERIFKLYQELESMMDSFEEYIDEVRDDIDRDRNEVNDMSRQATAIYLRALEQTSGQPSAHIEPIPIPQSLAPEPPRPEPPEKKEREPRPSKLTKRDREVLEELSTKQQRVRFLMSRGFSLHEVARELGIGTGEVKLIAELEK